MLVNANHALSNWALMVNYGKGEGTGMSKQ